MNLGVPNRGTRAGDGCLASLQVDQPAGERHRDRLGPVRHTQFGEDILEMDLDRLVHAPDGLGHFLVAQAPGHELQDLELPLGEVAPLRKLGEPGGHRVGITRSPRQTARMPVITSVRSMSLSR